jgi:hypothetical protein
MGVRCFCSVKAYKGDNSVREMMMMLCKWFINRQQLRYLLVALDARAMQSCVAVKSICGMRNLQLLSAFLLVLLVTAMLKCVSGGTVLRTHSTYDIMYY